jgi:hypothetical protein
MTTLIRYITPQNLRARGRVLLTVVVAAAVGGGATLASGAAGASSPESRPAGAGVPTVPVQSADAVDVQAFSTLGRAAAPSDTIPASASVIFSAASGANTSLARHATAIAATGAVTANAWLVPGSGRMCLIAASAASADQKGAACVSDGAATAGELLLETSSKLEPGRAFVAGLVPDGVSAVSLTTHSGATVVAPVQENVYAAEVSGWVVSASFNGPSGSVSVQSPE